jgi:hypothetical protein
MVFDRHAAYKTFSVVDFFGEEDVIMKLVKCLLSMLVIRRYLVVGL